MFNEQKRYELNIQRLQSHVHRANSAMEKMRTEAVGLRMKIQELVTTASGYSMEPSPRIKQHWRNVTQPWQTYDPY